MMTKLAAIQFYFFLDELEKIAQVQENPEAAAWMRRLKERHAQQYGLTGLDPELAARKQQAQQVLKGLPHRGDVPDPAQMAARRKVLESRMQQAGMVSQTGWQRPEGLPTRRTAGPRTPFEPGGRPRAVATVVPGRVARPVTIATGAHKAVGSKVVRSPGRIATGILKLIRRAA